MGKIKFIISSDASSKMPVLIIPLGTVRVSDQTVITVDTEDSWPGRKETPFSHGTLAPRHWVRERPGKGDEWSETTGWI